MKKVPLWSIGVSVGLLLLFIGYTEGQLAEIFRKAVMICLECIGIG